MQRIIVDLPEPRRAGDDDALAFHDLQIDVTQHVEVTVPLVHVGDFDGDVRCGDRHFLWLGHFQFPFSYRL